MIFLIGRWMPALVRSSLSSIFLIYPDARRTNAQQAFSQRPRFRFRRHCIFTGSVRDRPGVFLPYCARFGVCANFQRVLGGVLTINSQALCRTLPTSPYVGIFVDMRTQV